VLGASGDFAVNHAEAECKPDSEHVPTTYATAQEREHIKKNLSQEKNFCAEKKFFGEQIFCWRKKSFLVKKSFFGENNPFFSEKNVFLA